MKPMIQDMNALTDSRELLEAKPHKFTVIFIYIIMILITASLAWAYFGEMDIVIKANGVVRPINQINKVINEYDGKIAYINLKNGQKVKESEVLYSIDQTALGSQKSSVEENIQKLDNELENLKKLKKSISDGQNYFNEYEESEKTFYNKYLQYEANFKDESAKVKSVQAQVQDIKNNLENLQLLQQSINSNENCLPENSSYYNQFVDYKANIKQYEDKVNEAQRNYDIQKQLGEAEAIAENDVIKAKNEFENAKDELQKYKNENALTIQQNVDQYNEKLKETQNITTEQFTINQIVQIDTNIKEDEDNLKVLKDNLKDINLNIEKCIVKAPISGTINIVNEINKGDILQNGTEIATIIPDDNSEYKMQLYIANKDIANIKEGQKIQYHFTSLPYQEYGYLEGTITTINADSMIDSKTGESVYLAEATVENKPLYSYKKEKVGIRTGMDCEASVITNRKKFLYYLLEKLGLKD